MKENVYIELIESEIPKSEAPKCFLGAWYHKVFSSTDFWEGIEGVIILPEVSLKRFDGLRNLDVSSIYMGGMAKYESDVGLAYMRGYILKEDKKVLADTSNVFRPFWRYITDMETDEGTYDLANGRNYASLNLNPNSSVSNCYAQYSPDFTEHYYLPGDKLKMSIVYPKKDYMQLIIEVIEASSIKSSIELRKINKWENPKTFISPLFSSPELDKKSFKRVNAIDQVSNEGKPTIMTDTVISNAVWESVYLIKHVNGVKSYFPLNDNRGTVMNCPDVLGFRSNGLSLETGGETITIIPKNAKETYNV